MILTTVFLLAMQTANAQNDTVLFSVRGGFYEDVFALQLSHNNPQNHIRYTTNGNCPTAQSLAYEGYCEDIACGLHQRGQVNADECTS